MRKINLIIALLYVGLISVSAQQKIDRMDDNKWNWHEGIDKCQSIEFDDGCMVIKALKKYKGGSWYQNMAKTFARLPLRAKDDYKLTIKCIVPDYKKCQYWVYFNTSKKCLDDEDEGNTGDFSTFRLLMKASNWVLDVGKKKKLKDKLPGKVKDNKNHPMEFVIDKKRKKVEIEINGIQIYKDECTLTEPCIGFVVPVGSSLKVDEVIIYQNEESEE